MRSNLTITPTRSCSLYQHIAFSIHISHRKARSWWQMRRQDISLATHSLAPRLPDILGHFDQSRNIVLFIHD
jgi:hypothetical protein